MAVHIRLRRMGAKKRPFYRIVAADSRRARDGRFLDTLGTYNPITVPAEVKLAEDKLAYWLDRGAEPSVTVKSLLTQVGFTEKYAKSKKGEDVSEIELKTTIKERPKRTRKVRKAVAKAAEEEKAKAEKAAKEAEAAAEAEAKPEGEEQGPEESAEETKAESE